MFVAVFCGRKLCSGDYMADIVFFFYLFIFICANAIEQFNIEQCLLYRSKIRSRRDTP